MDNVTHALVGLLCAEAVIAWRSQPGSETREPFRRSARLCSIAANNVNDADSAYARALGGKLGYVLHHRGYTHTVPVALLLGLLIFLAARALLRRSGSVLERGEARALLGLCLLGPVLHIAMDFGNNYGVHPFWPAYAGWYYGDCLFIIEPWFWVFWVPLLLTRAETVWGRALLHLVLVAGLGLSWALHIVPWGAALALTLGALAALLLTLRLGSLARFGFAGAGTLLVLLAFWAGSRRARASVVQASKAPDKTGRVLGESLLDVVITPMPADPLCYSAITVSVRAGTYIARSGRVSVLPRWLPAERCRVQPTGLSLGLTPPRLLSSARVRWEGEWHGLLAELRRLNQSHCQVAALLRFARVPFWRESGQHALFIGDLRFDRDPARDFDEFDVSASAPLCPLWVPGWLPPRGAMLEARAP